MTIPSQYYGYEHKDEWHQVNNLTVLDPLMDNSITDTAEFSHQLTQGLSCNIDGSN